MEVVNEQEAREFADEINAYFKYTSAKINSGIEDLFKELGERYLLKCKVDLEKNNKRKYPNDKNKTNEYTNDNDKSIRISSMDQNKPKKKCCGGK